MIDVLKQNSKEEVVVKIIITLTKAQHSNPLIIEKITYYLKTYEKDSFIICIDNLAR